MSDAGRMAVFLLVVLSIWTGLHAALLWWVARTPIVVHYALRRTLLVSFAALWLAYPLARLLDARGLERLAYPLELVGAIWMGIVFLAFVAVLAAKLVSLPLLLVASGTGRIADAVARGIGDLPAYAAAAALCLGLIGAVQHARGPVVVEHEVRLPGLPAERDGTVLVQLSDLHLGSLLGGRWLEHRRAEVEALRPDLIAVVGDLVDGNAARVERLVPLLTRIRAPLGVWAVTGNHEFYAGLERSVGVMESSGFRVLRDGWAEVVPGLVLAGVDDLTARQQFAAPGTPAQPMLEAALERALAGRPQGATILLSHTPWLAERAAAGGAGLMLAGHTHDGQIWPFNYLVAMRYPYIGGAYEVGAMRLLVCRGTGSWGPPLRLWRRGEIVRIVLRSPLSGA